VGSGDHCTWYRKRKIPNGNTNQTVSVLYSYCYMLYWTEVYLNKFKKAPLCWFTSNHDDVRSFFPVFLFSLGASLANAQYLSVMSDLGIEDLNSFVRILPQANSQQCPKPRLQKTTQVSVPGFNLPCFLRCCVVMIALVVCCIISTWRTVSFRFGVSVRKSYLHPPDC
jgi:hypothetical protein